VVQGQVGVVVSRIVGLRRGRTMYINVLSCDYHRRKSNCKVYAYIVKHNYILGGMLFTICKAQVHVSALNVGHLQVAQ
jgi:hypothetical protein